MSRRGIKWGIAKPEVIDGHRFASQAEARRYTELRILLRAGLIRNLKLQPKFPIEVRGTKVCTYIADFRYQEIVGGRWQWTVEDVKGMPTPIYRLKRKLTEALYGIRIQEIAS